MSTYQVLADFRVIKNVLMPGPVPGWGYWHVTEVGQYVYFPSETRWLFVNKQLVFDDQHDQNGGGCSMKSTIILRYCAHRSHTPTTNFADTLHREVVREEWAKLERILKELERRQSSDQTRKAPLSSCRKRRYGATTKADSSVYSAV